MHVFKPNLIASTTKIKVNFLQKSKPDEAATDVRLLWDTLYIDLHVRFSRSAGGCGLCDNTRHSSIFCVSNNVGSQSDICNRVLARVPILLARSSCDRSVLEREVFK